MEPPIYDGGPAFPHVLRNEYDSAERGMSLRDYFAAKAMQGMCAHPDNWGLSTPQIADRAYLIADAMIRARDEA